MRLAIWSLALIGLAGITIGCSKTSMPGGPGASEAPAVSPNAGASQGPVEPAQTNPTITDKADTFTLKVPALATHIKRGATHEATLSLSRGSKFNQPVTLNIEAPAGVTVNPAHPTIEAGQTEVKVTFAAADDAALGEHQIKVSATPQTGAAVAETMNLTIDEK